MSTLDGYAVAPPLRGGDIAISFFILANKK
jgi:hypothetical protein